MPERKCQEQEEGEGGREGGEEGGRRFPKTIFLGAVGREGGRHSHINTHINSQLVRIERSMMICVLHIYVIDRVSASFLVF